MKPITYNFDELPNEIELSPKAKNLRGEKFGRLTCLFPCGKDSDGSFKWVCKCSCKEGNYIIASSSNLRKGRNKTCGSQEDYIFLQENNQKNKRNEIIGKIFNNLKVDSFSHIINKKIYYNCTCLNCGSIVKIRKDSLLNEHATSCGCIKSKSEEKIAKILSNRNIKFLREYSFQELKDKKPLRFDFAIFKENNLLFLLEYDGVQHFKTSMDWWYDDSLEERAKRDELKNKYCLINNIKLIRIRYDEDLDKRMEDLLNELYI